MSFVEGNPEMCSEELTEETSSMVAFRSRKGVGRNEVARRKRVSEKSDSSNDAEDKDEVVKHIDGRKKRKNPMIQSVCF